MIPTAYESGNISSGKLGGYGKLTEIIRCEINEELNGDYSLEFDYPVTGRFYDALKSSASIMIVGPTGKQEVFDVFKYSVPINGVVTFYCNHASRRLANYILTGNLTVKTIGTNIASQVVPTMGGDGMSAGVSNSTGSQQTVILSAPASLLSALIGDGESLAAQGFEIVFSTSISAIDPNAHPGISVSVKTRRGADNGAVVRFGANMVDIEYITDETDTYNAFFPFWTDGNGGVIKPTGNAIAQPTTPITPIKAVPLDLTSVYQSQPTSAEMLTYATALLDATTPWVLKKTISCDLINGTDNELKGTKVELGDTVHVYWSDADISEDLRVVSYKYDVLAEKYMEIKLGTPTKNYVAITGIND